MAWNRPSEKAAVSAIQKRKGFRFPVLAVAVLIAALVAVWFVFSGDDPSPKGESAQKAHRTIKAQAPAHRVQDAPTSEEEHVRKIRAEINEKAANFVTERMTNIVEILGEKPLDPDDPDNALRTRFAKDVATILAIQPGEAVPEILVFSFMFEDDARAAAEAEGREYKGDGGNKDFLESLKKWKVTMKESDGESLAATKENLVKSQLELLDGLKEGLSPNDSIRAAYEYRVKAAEFRHELIDMLKEIHTKENNDVAATRGLIAEANKILDEKGFMRIHEESVLSDEEIFENPAVEVGSDSHETSEEQK